MSPFFMPAGLLHADECSDDGMCIARPLMLVNGATSRCWLRITRIEISAALHAHAHLQATGWVCDWAVDIIQSGLRSRQPMQDGQCIVGADMHRGMCMDMLADVSGLGGWLARHSTIEEMGRSHCLGLWAWTKSREQCAVGVRLAHARYQGGSASLAQHHRGDGPASSVQW